MRLTDLVLGLVSTAFAVESRSVRRQYPNDTLGTLPYELKTGPLDTEWTSKVGTSPWPEYPRPQLARSEWKNLNGVWQYSNTTWEERDNPPFGRDLDKSVLVPFCLESALSGIMGSNAYYSWYRTSFDVDFSWIASDKRVLLNFGAVDYEANVYVNGKAAGNNTGGYFHFSVDVTDLLNTNGTNELILYIHDPTNTQYSNIPLGKQRLNPDHINYTPCSGIWQTVWLESAGREYITQLDVDANMDGKVNVTVHTSPNAVNSSGTFEITIFEPNSTDIKVQKTGSINQPFTFEVDSPNLWSPESPTLYDISVQFGSDSVKSYTGFRTISKGEVDGVVRPLLNGKFVFLFGPLDQGFWPDGLHSPPSVEAMEYDLHVLKDVGFNMVRKHIKIEPGLFYKACDTLGLLVVQDMPSMPTYWYPSNPPGWPSERGKPYYINSTQQEVFEHELARMIEQLKSHPSIVTWVIYNEGWGQNIDDIGTDWRLTDLVRSLDPTRLVDSVTGWNDHGAGDYSDNHHYSGALCGTPFWSGLAYDEKRIAFQGEFGGIGLNASIENLWKVDQAIAQINSTYELTKNTNTWNYRTHNLLAELAAQTKDFACSGAVYTQTTDVEGEVNGLLTYDRRVNRMDITQWKDDIRAIFDAAHSRAVTKETRNIKGLDEEVRMVGL
ncbi:putative hydrolase [Massarina eburnea CBS 473.64]|uniref:Putative hydrolase n=1 Tax=Massarina eburnea CBS 473.64 TaxID=1395130 RepID=A0A6A6S7C4_9PLEO|nr:putative hydrolase [Massarina eburnea CBS 473.64]